MAAEFFQDKSLDPAVSGFAYRAADSAADALVLTHGAGSNSKSPLLIALSDVFAGAGITVLRCDLLYRQARPYGPPRPRCWACSFGAERCGGGRTEACFRKNVAWWPVIWWAAGCDAVRRRT